MLVGLLEARGEVARGGTGGPRTAVGPRGARLPGRPGRAPRGGVGRARPAPAAPRSASPAPRPRSTPLEPNHVGQAGTEAVVEGVRGTWRVDTALLDEPFRGRTALLSPLDRLVADRKRMGELFGFDYQLEMYKPVAARTWGYWAMPVLHGDRLVGKVDATADRDRGVLRVDAVHWDEESPAAVAGVERELRSLARWLGLELARPA